MDDQHLPTDEGEVQGDFPIEDLLNLEKQNVFQSAFESYFKPLGSNVGLQTGNKYPASSSAVYNPFASSFSNYNPYGPFAGSNVGTTGFGVNKGPSNRCGQCSK